MKRIFFWGIRTLWLVICLCPALGNICAVSDMSMYDSNDPNLESRVLRTYLNEFMIMSLIGWWLLSVISLNWISKNNNYGLWYHILNKIISNELMIVLTLSLCRHWVSEVVKTKHRQSTLACLAQSMYLKCTRNNVVNIGDKVKVHALTWERA